MEREGHFAGVLQIQPELGPVPPHCNVYFHVTEVDASLQKAKELKGEQIYNIVDEPKVGLMGIRDPQVLYLPSCQWNFCLPRLNT